MSSKIITRKKKVIVYPETRQTFNFDCGANSLMSMLVYAGIEEREERIAKLAGTTREGGTNTAGVRFVMGYFGLEIVAGEHRTTFDLRDAIDQDHPTMIALQAYRDGKVITPYSQLFTEGHWVVAIGYEDDRILFEDPASFHRTWLAEGELDERWHDMDTVDGLEKEIEHWGATLLVSGIYNHDATEHMD